VAKRCDQLVNLVGHLANLGKHDLDLVRTTHSRHHTPGVLHSGQDMGQDMNAPSLSRHPARVLDR